MSRTMAWEIVVPQGEEPKRVENFLKKRFPIGYVRKLFRKNGVRLNGKRCGAGELARAGDRLLLFVPFEERPRVKTKPSPRAPAFQLLFEDDELLVVNKPAGLAVHEGKRVLKTQSLLGMLEAAYRSRSIFPRLVHRIDRETSGVLLVAKTDAVAEELERIFEAGEVEKEYLALVVGRVHPKKGIIDFPLSGREGKAVRALTRYQVEKELPGTSLVRVNTATGRMHQIRIHFSKLGHPVVMDDRYGDFTFNKGFRKTHGLKRQFLHARSIALPRGGGSQRWTAPLPDDLARTLDSLDRVSP